MYKNKFIALFLFLSCSLGLHAQDFVQKIPGDANLVTTINTKAFFEQLDIEDLNKTLGRLGLFEFTHKEGASGPKRLQDFGIDWDSRAYLFVKGTDSIQYFGALIPLANKDQFAGLIPAHKKIEQVNGLPTVYSADRSLRVSWDQQTLYVLGGMVMGHYFKQPHVMERYGLREAYGQVDVEEAPIVDTAVAWDDYDLDEMAADTLAIEIEEDYYAPDIAVADSAFYDEYAAVDSVLALPQYADNYSSSYDSIYRHNDSIQRSIIKGWLDTEMDMIVTGKSTPFDGRKLPKVSREVLAHIHATDIASSLERLYPVDIWKSAFGGGKPSLDYGIEAFDATVEVQQNKLKMKATATLDKEMSGYYKAIYNRKLNSKFYNYLDKDLLGFFSFNMNTEAYIKHLPAIFEKYYGSMLPGREDYISLFTTLFDIILDEKAISKVFKGDNLLVLNGVTKVEVAYKDYEYDDDYNAKVIERTKMETIPQFLWMFSSDDTRIFNKLISLGVKENLVIEHEGVFEMREKVESGIRLLFLIKDDVVFFGNDMDKMRSIQAGTIKTQKHSPYVSLAKKSKFSLVFNTRQIPLLVEELDIPVHRSFEENIKEMAEYGDFYMTSGPIKGNKFSGETVLEFPKRKGNVLAFLLDVIDQWSLKSK